MPPRFEVISLFPDMFRALTGQGVSGRALANGLAHLQVTDPRDFTRDPYRTVDDRPFGGGPGMVMLAEPIDLALSAIEARLRQAGVEQVRKIYLSPQGRVLNQALVGEIGAEVGEKGGLILLCGRYEGVDERLLQRQGFAEVSIGDYVLSGGELPAMVLLDALIRRIPGTLGNAASAEEDSFATGLLDCPHYTRPEVYCGLPVPAVLRSGDHAAIARWRLMQALGRTAERRPDLLDGRPLSRVEQDLLDAYRRGEGRE